MRVHLRQFTTFLSLTGLLWSSGCVSTWETKTGPQKSSRLGVTADLPAGWARYNPDRDIVMTRDGFLLQTIRVTRQAFGTKLPHTDRKITKGLEAQDAAQVLIDDLMADQTRRQLTVIDNRPITVAGQPGFRLEFTYRSPEGVTMHEVLYVALVDDSYVIARYAAPERHYFEMSNASFEQVVASLKITGPAPPLEKKN
jgi:hypothetical protein